MQHLDLEESTGHSTSPCALKDDLPLLPNFIRRLAEERMELKSADASAHVILKVPSFQPTDGRSSPLKELVLKEEELSNTEKETSSCDSGKSHSRPKRGRYRNYDRDNLACAVRAVQKGEMSVHRAGTFYGVPHSTLEYKVKERHLLRPKKRYNFSNTSDVFPSKSDEFKSVKNLNQMAIEASKESTEDRPSIGPLWQTMPFFSVDFSHLASNNYFASQMMRKLQENAKFHEEMQKSQHIIESFIHSSLTHEHKPLLLLNDSFPESKTLQD